MLDRISSQNQKKKVPLLPSPFLPIPCPLLSSPLLPSLPLSSPLFPSPLPVPFAVPRFLKGPVWAVSAVDTVQICVKQGIGLMFLSDYNHTRPGILIKAGRNPQLIPLALPRNLSFYVPSVPEAIESLISRSRDSRVCPGISKYNAYCADSNANSYSQKRIRPGAHERWVSLLLGSWGSQIPLQMTGKVQQLLGVIMTAIQGTQPLKLAILLSFFAFFVIHFCRYRNYPLHL